MRPWVTWTFFAVAFLYNLVDALQTKQLLLLGVTEANPLMSFAIELWGPNVLFVIKVIVFTFAGLFLYLHQIEYAVHLKLKGGLDGN